MPSRDPKLKVRSVFVSDIHLGTRGARSDMLLDFLARVECEHLYLVGDVIDGWRLRKAWYWHAEFDAVMRAVLEHAERGARVTYIPGNHDEMFRDWLGLEIAGVTLKREAVHLGADGRKFLVIHGDEFDGVIRYAKFLAYLGDWAYDTALVLNRWFNLARKRQVKEAVKAIDRFEVALAGEARRRGLDGVICGHIHHAEMRMVNGVMYMNDGDWVESCTALVEHPDGRFELLDWAAHQRAPERLREALPA
jgi:UDP-2,3-diacylglucosamine pyrophosphatase LpxH